MCVYIYIYIYIYRCVCVFIHIYVHIYRIFPSTRCVVAHKVGCIFFFRLSNFNTPFASARVWLPFWLGLGPIKTRTVNLTLGLGLTLIVMVTVGLSFDKS